MDRIVAWGKLADAVKPLLKGDHVLVEGEHRSNEYEAEMPRRRQKGHDRAPEPAHVGNPCARHSQAGQEKEACPESGEGRALDAIGIRLPQGSRVATCSTLCNRLDSRL